jgi:hypothetical protein
MKTRSHSAAIILGILLAGAPALGWTQDNSAKQDMTNAGHETANATKDAAHGTKQGAQKAYHATKRGTTKAWNKTRNTTKGAVSGAKNGARQPPQ